MPKGSIIEVAVKVRNKHYVNMPNVGLTKKTLERRPSRWSFFAERLNG